MTPSWANWSGLVSCTPGQIAYPASEAEIIALVRQAADRRQVVRVCGSGHSFVPLCASNDLLLSLDRYFGVETVDRDRREATIRAGTKLHTLGQPLAEHGLALENQGDIDKQALAGAVSTGTHGTGRALGNIATQVVGLRLVTATGELLEVNGANDPRRLQSLAVSLGACGVVTAITMRLLPAYRLHERTWREPIQECLDRLEERIAATRHFEFFWYPATDEAFCKALHPTDSPPDGRPASDGERIDHNYRIFPTERNVKFNEMEYAVPDTQGPSCFQAIRGLMRNRHGNVTWPIEYRTVAADAIDLSPDYGRATVAISIHQAADLEHRAFFADAEPIFRAHDGRPHWGKLHSLTAAELRPLYPRWDHFCGVRSAVDPDGMFLNDYLRRLFTE